MKIDKSLYPITVKMLADHPEQVHELFKRLSPHKEAFIGVCELEGTFLCDSLGELFESLYFGERLSLLPENEKTQNPALEATRSDGTVIGSLPFSDSLLPNMLIARGLEVFCYIEAKKFNGGMPSVAVSIYCERY